MCRCRGVLIAAFVASSCASYAPTPRLTTYDLSKGYRFERLPKSASTPAKNSDELFVVLAFSGGGTRAGALSYGVLAQLASVKFHWNAATGQPEACAPVDSAACQASARSLLDEVDVISSVSGGSFASAYYALYREKIFDSASTFHRRFLYYPVQRDLMSHAIYYPQNWKRLRSRVEIAASDYTKHIFGDATFAALTSRPYLILNATDSSTGARFEFTQEQFDLLCGDLSRIPVARGVAASSAFPGLLNAMTIDTFNDETGCKFNGPGASVAEKRRVRPPQPGDDPFRDEDWVQLALEAPFVEYRRYNAARELLAYRDPARQHLHLLDGGLADNIGLRSVLQSLLATDRPLVPQDAGEPLKGGWNLRTDLNLSKVKRVVVITVNARTNKATDRDRKTAGPGSLAVLGSAPGLPMGNYSNETLQLLRDYANEAELNKPGRPEFLAFEVAFENIPDADKDERAFLSGLGTNFDLSAFEVNCLIDRGGRLLRNATSVSGITPANPTPVTFQQFVRDTLGGRVSEPDVPHPAACTASAGKREIGTRSHYIDIGVKYEFTRAQSPDVTDDRGVGLAVRVAKPDGFGMTVGYGTKSFGILGDVQGASKEIGRLNLRTVSAGLIYTIRAGPVDIGGSFSGGYGFGGVTIEDDVRDAFARAGIFGVKPEASNSWVLEPGASIWYSLNSRWAATLSGSYVWARPTVRFDNQPGTSRTVTTSAVKVSAGLAFRVF